jgi:23S rRNA pseudouridine2605 synthase
MNSRNKSAPQPVSPGDRLQKVMAAAGLGSRRSLEQLIAAGAVLVNGSKAALGSQVRPGDLVRLRDQEWQVAAVAAQHRTLIYNKPEGELTSRADPDGRRTVFDRLPAISGARWVAVGRLDINTTGLLLLTTDGELAHAMMHPSNQVDREYVCRIRGQVSDEQVDKLRQGVQLEDGPARFSDIQRLPGSSGNQWFQVTILEGRNREVRRLWEAVGCTVSRLKRVRYGAAKLPRGLRAGAWAEISPQEHRVLRQDVKLPAGSPPQLNLRAVADKGSGRAKPPRRAARPGKPARPHKAAARPGDKPGSPAGSGRRPHPLSRKARRS